MSRGIRAAGLALCVVVALGASTATAQEADSELQRSALARSLFQEGLGFVAHQDWAAAADRFRRANELHPSPAIRLNLALADEHLGRLVEAYELAAETAQDAGAPDELRQQASSAAERLQSRVGRLRIRVQGQTPEDQITVDGRTIPSVAVGVAMPTDPGTHAVALVRSGETITTVSVEVTEGGTADATLAVLAVGVRDAVEDHGVDASLRPAPPQSGGRSVLEEWWFWAIVGGTAAVAVVVLVTALAASSAAATPIGGNLTPPFIDVEVR